MALGVPRGVEAAASLVLAAALATSAVPGLALPAALLRTRASVGLSEHTEHTTEESSPADVAAPSAAAAFAAAFFALHGARVGAAAALRAAAELTPTATDDRVAQRVCAEADGPLAHAAVAWLAARAAAALDAGGVVDTLLTAAERAQYLRLPLLALATLRAVRLAGDVVTLLVLPDGRQQELADEKRHVGWLRTTVKVVHVALLGIGALFIAENAGVNVGSVVTTLGISGLTIALSSQALLQDFAAFLALCMDAPFVVGDSVSFAGTRATVESIGLKTTHLRHCNGELHVWPNKDLASKPLINHSDHTQRRSVLRFELAPSTDAAHLDALPEILRAALEPEPAETCRFEAARVCDITVTGLLVSLSWTLHGATTVSTQLDLEGRVRVRVIRELRRRGARLGCEELMKVRRATGETGV